MNWAALLQPQALPELLAALATAALALWLVRLGARRPVNLAFAAFLLSRSASMLIFTVQRTLEHDPASRVEEMARWEAARPVVQILTVGALVQFLLLYPRPRLRGDINRNAAMALAASTALFLLLYVVRPSLWASYSVMTLRDGAQRLFIDSIGPLFVFQFARILGIGVAALVVAHDLRRSKNVKELRPLYLVFLAFALHAVFDGSDAAQLLLTIPWGSLAPNAQAQLVLEVVDLLPVALGVAWIFRRLQRDTDPSTLVMVRGLSVLALPVLTNALVFGLVASGLEPPNGPSSLFFLGVWRLSLPLLVTYALLRHSLFDVDVKVKRAIQRFVVALGFVLVFYSVSEGAEAVVSGQAGPIIGILLTILLAFLLRPLEQLALRVADAALPTVATKVPGAGAAYAQIAEAAGQGGRMGPGGRKILDAAREALGIPEGEAKRIERQHLRFSNRPRKRT